MHASDPGRPTLVATSSLASMSQRIAPLNQLATSSVGQIRALMKSKNNVRTTQNTRPAAARLRFLICHKKGGTSMMIVMQANSGTITAKIDMGNSGLPIVTDIMQVI